MATNIDTFKPDSSIIKGMVIDSKDIFSMERYEERTDLDLAELLLEFRKHGRIDIERLRKVVEAFISEVTAILTKLEDVKGKLEIEEIRKIDEIKELLKKGASVKAKSFRIKLDKMRESLQSNTISALRSYRRREKRLSRGNAPRGFIILKLRQSGYRDKHVAAKSIRYGEDTLTEHRLLPQVIHLIDELNTNPNQEISAELSQKIELLVQSYERNIDDFLDIEIDIDIEEAKKFHRINHYIVFLRMIRGSSVPARRLSDDLIGKLNALKEHAKKWISQDSVDARRMIAYAKVTFRYAKNLLESSHASEDEDFPGIVTRGLHLINQKVPGLLVLKEDIIDNMGAFHTNNAIVLVHGFCNDKRILITLGKRLASQNFVVYIIDLPEQGESRDKLRLGRCSEFILNAVEWFRFKNVRNVVVVGYSLGALSAMFALSGYNSEIETKFYDSVSRVIDYLSRLKELPEDRYQQAEQIRALLSSEHEKLEQLVRIGQEKISSLGRINAVILLGLPISVHFVHPPWKWKIAKRIPKGVIKPWGVVGMQFKNTKIKLAEGRNATIFHLVPKTDVAHMGSLAIANPYDLFSYLEKVKSPYDYINWINYLCDDVAVPNGNTGVFRYYRDFIRAIPKLYAYGLKDEVVKPYIKNNMPELEGHYKDFGATEIVRYPDMNHALNEKGQGWHFEKAKLPALTYKIITFLKRHL